MGCFKEVEHNVFTNTRVSLILQSKSNAGCHVRHHSQDVSKYAGVLYESMTDPEFARSHDVDKAPRVFALRKDGTEDTYWEMIKNDNFHRGMVGHSEIVGASAVLHHYPWDDVSSVVDIGSGIGAFSIPLAKMFPHLRITDQDLPEIIKQAQTAWERDAPEALLDDHVEFVALDFFQGVPVAGKDVYYLRNIIHDWPGAEETQILCNVRKAMESNSRVLIHECVLFHSTGTDGLSVAPEPMLPNFGAGSRTAYHQDLTMWFSLNAKERTVDELKIIGQVASIA
ncbi:S-adenosyl-L-methionine-dependent methyltransferase [Rhizopogon vinicolor AM-OR11-026]|uniref:S-adenosyl-L-methionine-dependent methyltransferase n=1 Tax=Rhizopogon vinicolor AM-OR11-026 TaxID=1314800 RepID=A0A1B7N298_9AGAM|nr:S-adenosyl-L-methionine-dependent methyltransferase [Rhizopogon vinicolor AM-OR11-026]